MFYSIHGEKAMEQHISFKRKNTIQSDKANDKWENLVGSWNNHVKLPNVYDVK